MALSPLAYPGTRQTFFVSALAVAPASGKSMISLETTSANIVLRLHAIQVYNVQSSAVVGTKSTWFLTPAMLVTIPSGFPASTTPSSSSCPGETFVITSPAVVAAGYDIGTHFYEVDP